MITRIFTFLMMAVFSLTATTQLTGQCTGIGIIGEHTEWGSDIVMDRDADNPALFTTIITFTEEHDMPPGNENGFIDFKFRQLGDWGTAWGSTDFPSGTAATDGGDIPATPGTYFVTFNCETGDFSFVATCTGIGLIGEHTEWGSDVVMDRDIDDINLFTTTITFTEDHDTLTGNSSGFIDFKFRQLDDWSTAWGSTDFPSGSSATDGGDIPGLPGTYFVTFNCATGDFSFESTCPNIGLIGEFTEWSADHLMDRSADDANSFTTTVTFTEDHDLNENGVIDFKFRHIDDWGTAWGSTDFPSGGSATDGGDIPGTPGTYFVTFNCATGDFSFESTCGVVSMVGEFNNWNGDFPMDRDATDPNMWTAIKSFNASHDGDGNGNMQLKFRENGSWDFDNWGAPAFPSGTAELNGDNITADVATDIGTYDVSFNCSTFAYNFVINDNVCGDIGMIGDFNGWGVSEDTTVPTDENLVRDPNHPSQFSLDYSFTSSTNLLFRENADPVFNDVWGGSSFPSGTAVADNGVTQLAVPGGNYRVTFNCLSGDYNFIRLGSSVSAPEVFALSVDGDLAEADWNFTQNVSGVVDGEAGDDAAVASFAVAYNADVLYVAGKITDGTVIGDTDAALIYVDGNKNGGDYDDSDIALKVFADGTMEVIQGPDGISPTVAVAGSADGYIVEVSIAWADLGVTPETGSQIGFDFGVVDYDSDDFQSMIMWNGNANNDTKTSAFGDLLFGDLACGSLSIYSDQIGDVALHTLTDTPTNYVATYDFESADQIVFRKDNAAVVSWGVDAFPSGNAVIDGATIPVAAGRYRIAFSCLDGAFAFTEAAAGDGVALANYTETPATIDGDLSEYNLEYDMAAGVVDGTATDNTVAWGILWDETNLYLGAQVTDANIEGTGNPWDNDAIEMYFDGNHDSDGSYDGDFDTQIILDVFNGSTLWTKADGVDIDYEESILTMTTAGYNIELSLEWRNFNFVPGRGRTMGFTLGNNDNDDGIGRSSQTAWFGNADNWNNTGSHGDLQLAGGPFVDTNEPVMFSDNLSLFPNPAQSKGVFFVSSDGEVFTGEAQMVLFNLIGQNVLEQSADFGAGTVRVETNNLVAGTYFLVIATNDGKRAVKKVVLK